jgi:hypothetical protein
MAVFIDTGGGDIYGAETKEQAIAAILEDCPELESEQHEFFEVASSTPMRVENEDGSPGELSTLEDEYTNLGHGYCVASTNC